MSANGESSGKSLAYFSDGHIEVVTEVEISKDGHDIWFTVESGKWFVYREELVYKERPILNGNNHGFSKNYYPECKFYKVLIVRDHDEFGATCDVEYLVTDEIEKIEIFMDHG